jgi:hypothetical protein
MKRIVLALVFVVVFASQAFAVEHESVAIGFHHSSAPIGIRWWFNDGQTMAFDVGFGVTANDQGDDTETDFTFDLGLPILLKSWDRVHFQFRPGFVYESDAEVLLGEVERGSIISLLAELEAEVFITENFSVSASHGFGIFIVSPPEPEGIDYDSSTNFGTFGNNITDIGFHLYGLWD